MSHNITVEGGKTVRLTTAGKYCDQDIVVTAQGGGTAENLDDVLTEQEELISMYDGLKLEIGNIPKDFVPTDSERGLRMDEYLKKHNL